MLYTGFNQIKKFMLKGFTRAILASLVTAYTKCIADSEASVDIVTIYLN